MLVRPCDTIHITGKKLTPTFSKAQKFYLFCLLCFFPPQIDLQLARILFPWEQFAHNGSASPEMGSCVLGEQCPEAGIRLDIEMLDLSNGKTVLRSTRVPKGILLALLHRLGNFLTEAIDFCFKNTA